MKISSKFQQQRCLFILKRYVQEFWLYGVVYYEFIMLDPNQTIIADIYSEHLCPLELLLNKKNLLK